MKKNKKPESRTPCAVVTGDVTMDWNLARTQRTKDSTAAWNVDDRTRACWQRGGAALLADIIAAVANDLRQRNAADFTVRQVGAPRATVDPVDGKFHHSYAMWSLYKNGEGQAWRVSEFLGLDKHRQGGSPEKDDWKKVTEDEDAADVVVLDDADLGFRDRPDLWPKAITTEGRHPWIVLKMARPVAQGKLWEHLLRNHADRLIVLMTVNDLRLTEVQISRELSWERTAQDLFWELTHNPKVNGLSRCAHVVVSFDTAGVLLLSDVKSDNKPGSTARRPRCTLFFDPKIIEGMWTHDHPGGMIGYTSCLAGGIVRQLMLSTDKCDLAQGIQSGLLAMRTLHLDGYDGPRPEKDDCALAFPLARIVAVLAGSERRFETVEVADPVTTEGKGPVKSGFWTILEQRYMDNPNQLARKIVVEGVEKTLQNIPLGKFGGLLTVDRHEIESFRSIRSLILEYSRKSEKQPLSVAVFGPPGAGKSFGIEEVAKSVLPDKITVLKFNLSQFDNQRALLDALHQVRDVGLSGKLPLVFWDEFDTTFEGDELGWLAYFLAPMQDGKFQDGQITHPIGCSIFVFAGGTSKRMAEFDKGREHERFKTLKGPDFVSRLKGYVNIMGPNPQVDGTDSTDPGFIIRRAVLLRALLLRIAPGLFTGPKGAQLLHMDSGVLRAFLEVGEFKHGVRSMESIIAMSLLTGKNRFERSALPSEAQLDVHVNGREFLALVQQLELEGELLEKLAAAAHEVFCEGKKRDGWKYAPKRDNAKKLHPLLIPYEQLPETYKESNRVTVRNIPKKLARAGYVMIPSRSNEPPLKFPGVDLEALAEYEHELWMADKIAAGFTLGKSVSDGDKKSEYIVPWNDVPESIRQSDRDLVRGIPRILAKAGYAVVKLHPEARTPSA